MLESFKALCRDMKLKFTVEKVVEFTVLNVRFECNDIVISVYSYSPFDQTRMQNHLILNVLPLVSNVFAF